MQHARLRSTEIKADMMFADGEQIEKLPPPTK